MIVTFLVPLRDSFEGFCKQSRPRSGSSCKSCLIWVYSVCLSKYDISDPTLVGLTSTVELQWLEQACDHEKKVLAKGSSSHPG